MPLSSPGSWWERGALHRLQWKLRAAPAEKTTWLKMSSHGRRSHLHKSAFNLPARSLCESFGRINLLIFVFDVHTKPADCLRDLCCKPTAQGRNLQCTRASESAAAPFAFIRLKTIKGDKCVHQPHKYSNKLNAFFPRTNIVIFMFSVWLDNAINKQIFFARRQEWGGNVRRRNIRKFSPGTKKRAHFGRVAQIEWFCERMWNASMYAAWVMMMTLWHAINQSKYFWANKAQPTMTRLQTSFAVLLGRPSAYYDFHGKLITLLVFVGTRVDPVASATEQCSHLHWVKIARKKLDWMGKYF